MRPEYDGVKFYSKEDFGSAWALQKAEPTLASFNADGDYNDVLCLYWHNAWTSQIDRMIELGDLREKATLFSQPEADYLDYILNKSKFSDGLDLRNKYIHSTYSTNEAEQQTDYIQLLKLMVLIITKMNDEFCIWKGNKEVTP